MRRAWVSGRFAVPFWGLVLGVVLAGPALAADGVYKTVGPDGKVTYSQTPPVEGKAQKKLEFSHAPASPLPPEVLKFQREIQQSIAQKEKDALPPPGVGLRLFTAKWCGYCTQAKGYLKQRAVAFQEIDIDTAAGMVEFSRLGKGGVPLLTGQNLQLRGFSADAYAAALAR